MKMESSLDLGEVRPKIIIIDGNPGPRRKALLQTLRPFAEMYLFNCKNEYVESDTVESGIWEQTSDQDLFFDLALIHGGDHDKRDKINYKTRIWYSGGEGYDPRTPDDELHIYRSILGTTGVFSDKEALELVYFITKGGNRPPFLCSPNYDPDFERMTNIFHDVLLAPETLFDWQQFFESHDAQFNQYGKPWLLFKKTVLGMVQDGSPPNGMDNESYNEVLRQLRSVVFK